MGEFVDQSSLIKEDFAKCYRGDGHAKPLVANAQWAVQNITDLFITLYIGPLQKFRIFKIKISHVQNFRFIRI